MSQSRPPRQKQPAPPTPSSPLPGVVSAAVVLLVIGIIVGLLVSRAGSSTTPVIQAPTPLATTPDASAQLGVPTLPPTFTPAPTVTPAPIVNTQLLPTATTHTYTSAPPLTIDTSKKYTATIISPRGDIVIELLPDIAPQTVNNFVFLARQNFYNGLTWHRVLAGFMAQGGDPKGDGTGDLGYSIPDEFTDTISFNKPGIVAMAHSMAPNSGGSQFFITTGDASWLDGKYTVFGRVVSGQDIVDGIPLRDPDNPADTAKPGETILGITITES